MFGWYVWIIIALNRGMPLAAWSSLGPDRAPYPENTSPRCLDAHGTGRNVPLLITEKVEWSAAYFSNFDSVEDIFTNGLPLSGPIFDDDVAIDLGGQFQHSVNASGGDIRNENVPEAGFWQKGSQKGCICWSAASLFFAGPWFSWGGRLPGARHQARGWTWRESPIFVGNPRVHAIHAFRTSGITRKSRGFILSHVIFILGPWLRKHNTFLGQIAISYH